MIPPIRQLSTAALTYPGPLQLPTILSQKQFQTIWSIDEDLRRRTEQWIVKECPIPGKGPQLIDIITSMVRSYSGTILLISHDSYFIRELGIHQIITTFAGRLKTNL